MKNILVVVEGQTEEQFIKEVLAEELLKYDIFIVPKIVVTKRVKGGTNYTGGLSNYGQIRRDIINCLKDKSVYVTTFIDFYQLPRDFPGAQTTGFQSSLAHVEYLEEEFRKNIGDRRFVPYIQLHEFEGLLFSKRDGFEYFYPSQNVLLAKIDKIISDFPNPEDINDQPQTSPSNRLKAIISGYDKVIQGNLIALENGIDSILLKCPHFKSWVEKLIFLSEI